MPADQKDGDMPRAYNHRETILPTQWGRIGPHEGYYRFKKILAPRFKFPCFILL